jgi:NADPH:quinone reductase-like Zn-dependent oxidoreductase
MRDRNVETKLRLVTLQLESWKKLHDLITYGLDKAKPIISSEQERQFTEIRANLLQEIEYVLRELSMLAEVSGKAMSVLQRGISVRGVRDLTNDEVRRLESDWNAVFTKLGLKHGELKARRKELAEQTAFSYYLNRLLRRPATAH